MFHQYQRRACIVLDADGITPGHETTEEITKKAKNVPNGKKS